MPAPDPTQAWAEIVGEYPNQTLNLNIPRGDKGEKGDIGEANTLEIGTVTEGPSASVEITGDAPNQTLNIVLPVMSPEAQALAMAYAIVF